MRMHIGIFGRRNVGKSSLLNALLRQNVAIVSDVAGTTTDPVEKPMELLPLGPVLFIDTAGVDDEGMLGAMRVAKTTQVFDRTDLAVIVSDYQHWGPYEDRLVSEFEERKVPIIVVFNKIDLFAANDERRKQLQGRKIHTVHTVASQGEGCLQLREAILSAAPEEFVKDTPLVGDLIAPADVVVLVVPIDMEAPKGRLIMPQVQAIRDILDHDAMCMVVKERELADGLSRLAAPPQLVVTDSQAFLKVAADTPGHIPMTSFSILMARKKGDLNELVRGAMMIDTLRAKDRVLICEACSHHPIGDDIGRVKIPRWLTQYVGGGLEFEHYQGHDFPGDLSPYKLVVHCGSCIHNRREMLTRIARARQFNVPITNYGLAIAYSLGVFERALRPFPGAYAIYQEMSENSQSG
jgi:[FeFe] hydrogenase H-cluster maturation GTPase HydF